MDANIKNAEAGDKQARINLDTTIITAHEAGQLSQVSVKEGQYVGAGTQLMYIRVLGELSRQHDGASSLVKSARQPTSLALS
ncbi:hypothetical protein R0J93_24955, partial [Pseudoalteromonas sp. SIMBA_148]